MTGQNLELLSELQSWYAERCDGQWEHSYGISISTLDNPGWALKIDISGTYLFEREFETVDVRGTDENDWYSCKVSPNAFEAFCGPNRLSDIVSIFLEWAGKQKF